MSVPNRLIWPVAGSSINCMAARISDTPNVTRNAGVRVQVIQRPWTRPDQAAEGDACGNRHPDRDVLGNQQLARDRGRDGADGRDRHVDLTNDQNRDQAQRQHRRHDALEAEVGQVSRRQELRIEQAEEGPDQHDRDHDRHIAPFARDQAGQLRQQFRMTLRRQSFDSRHPCSLPDSQSKPPVRPADRCGQAGYALRFSRA